MRLPQTRSSRERLSPEGWGRAPCGQVGAVWVWGTGQLSTLLCSSASDSDCRGTRVGRVGPSGSTGDLVAASLGCAQALRCLRGCAEVTPLWRQRWGPGSPPPATYVWHGCRTPHRAALARPASRSLAAQALTEPSSRLSDGAPRCVPRSPGAPSRSREKRGAGRSAQAWPLPPAWAASLEPTTVLSVSTRVWLGQGVARGVCHLRCSTRRL